MNELARRFIYYMSSDNGIAITASNSGDSGSSPVTMITTEIVHLEMNEKITIREKCSLSTVGNMFGYYFAMTRPPSHPVFPENKPFFFVTFVTITGSKY